MKRFPLLFLSLLMVSFLQLHAQKYANQLKPILKDLPGWQAEEAEGGDMIFGEIMMITASRSYTKGDASLEAGIIIGGVSSMGQIPSNASYEDSHGFLRREEIKGYEGIITYDKDNNSGAVFVITSKEPHASFLSLTFEGIGWKEALDLAKKFDLDAIKKVADSIK